MILYSPVQGSFHAYLHLVGVQQCAASATRIQIRHGSQTFCDIFEGVVLSQRSGSHSPESSNKWRTWNPQSFCINLRTSDMSVWCMVYQLSNILVSQQKHVFFLCTLHMASKIATAAPDPGPARPCHCRACKAPRAPDPLMVAWS